MNESEVSRGFKVTCCEKACERETTRNFLLLLVTISDLVFAWAQVERQIEQMCQFVKQEAEEKSNEIKISAEEVRIS